MRLSADAWVRLTPNEMLSAPLVHLVSGVDEQARPYGHCGRPTSISGYTEWVSHGSPVITMGWDWCIRPSGRAVMWIRVDAPRSNVMLVDKLQRDVGWTHNLKLLAAFVDALPWTECTRKAIAKRYQWPR